MAKGWSRPYESTKFYMFPAKSRTKVTRRKLKRGWRFPRKLVFAHPAVIEEVDLLVQSHAIHVSHTLPLMSYDTTFNLGDHYVSVDHQARDVTNTACYSSGGYRTRAEVQRRARWILPRHSAADAIIAEACIPKVLDRQKAIVDAVQSVLPNLQQLNCWRHIQCQTLGSWARR